MKYEELLDRARKDLPEAALNIERFEVPKVRGHIQGNKTVISNFHQIAATLRRSPEHLIKFILKELATPGELKKTAFIFGSKVPASRVNEKIKQYAAQFVLCRECGKPDTQLKKENKVAHMRCLACGAKYPVKTII